MTGEFQNHTASDQSLESPLISLFGSATSLRRLQYHLSEDPLPKLLRRNTKIFYREQRLQFIALGCKGFTAS